MSPRPINKHVGLRIKPDSMAMVASFRVKPEASVVSAIRRLYKESTWTQQQLATTYGLSVSLVSKILRTDPKVVQQLL